MSRQIKKLTAYPLTHNVVDVVLDQQGYEIESNVNKIIIRTPDHFPLGVNSFHASIKDGYGRVIEVLASDPLSLKTTGFAGADIDGYDGLVIGNDGYIMARGVIKETSVSQQFLKEPAYVSISGHHWLLGGYDLEEDAYTDAVWHSFSGLIWEKLSTPPWGSRGNAVALSDGSNLWLLGGMTDANTFTREIWHADINPVSGDLVWDNSALVTNSNFLNGYVKATLAPSMVDAYVGSGGINLEDGTETSLVTGDGSDGYNNVIHYDPVRNILWNSVAGYRDERIIGDGGEHIYAEQKVGVYGYVHRQESASTNWNVSHGMNSTKVAPVCYTDDKDILIPNSCDWVDENTLNIGFSQAQAGRALILHATPYIDGGGSLDTSPDAYFDGTKAWMFITTDGDIEEPASRTSDNEINFTTPIDGYLVAWDNYTGSFDTFEGRRFKTSFSAIDGENAISMWQQTDAPLVIFRSNTSTETLINPLELDYTDDQSAIVTFTSPESDIRWTSYDLRHDGYRDDQEPWQMDHLNLGVNDSNRQEVYLIGSDGVWGSNDAGVHWGRQDAVGLDLPDYPVPVLIQGNMVATLNRESELARSLSGGDVFAITPNSIGEQVITWYGSLGVPVDTTYRVFVYERPSDVIWEQEYGHLPGEIKDRYQTHYVLPYPTSAVSANSQSVEITVDSVYGRDVEANEFAGDWLYVYTAATGELVDYKQIIRNTGASAGSNITLFPKELAVTPTASHSLQIVKSRVEGPVYYTALTRNTSLKHTLYHETNGTAFISSQERDQDWYAHMKSKEGLPSIVNTDENKDRTNLLHAELNRQRVASGQFYNDPDSLPSELLQRLGSQIGIDLDENLNLQEQRRIISLWHERIDSYGPCLDGLNNLIDLILGQESGVTVQLANPNADTLAGGVVNILVSQYADHHFDYDSTINRVLYDRAVGKWGMAVDTTFVSADLGRLIHSNLIHFRNLQVDGPLLITAHEFNSNTSALNIYFDTPEIAELPLQQGQSVIGIYSLPKQRKLFKFIEQVNNLMPHWVQVKYI